MSGNRRFILDTNAVISLLAGNHTLATQLESADYVGISVITYLEFLAFDDLTEIDRACFTTFCDRIDVVPLTHDDSGFMKLVLDLRRNSRLKLPDAIIGATALSRSAALVTNDSHFYGITLLPVQAC